MKKEQLKEELEIKIGLRVNIENRWYTVIGKAGKPDTWVLEAIVGHYGNTKTIHIQRTSSQIVEYHYDRIAYNLLSERFGIKKTREEAKADSFAKGAYEFRKKLLAARERSKAQRERQHHQHHQLLTA